MSGTTIYAGGSFTTIGGISANRIAQLNGTTWSTLGSGPGNGVNPANLGDPCAVYALAVSGTDLFVGGVFAQASGVASGFANNIVKWNGSTFSALSTGTTFCDGACIQIAGGVFALAVSGTDLYVGGAFNNRGIGIAKWNGVWSALGSGIDVTGFNNVTALAASGANIYVGGNFAGAGGIANTKNIAIWDGSAWSALDSGMNAPVFALTVSGTSLYAGGDFTATTAIPADRIAKWNTSTSTWSTLGTGINGNVYALAFFDGALFAGGDFITAEGDVVNQSPCGTARIGAAWGQEPTTPFAPCS